MTSNNTNPNAPPGEQQEAPAGDQHEHEHEVEDREAYEYWGYLFKGDKTGTDKLKGLLRGLKELMNKHYEPSENPDLTPTQLASFYRELHGNYDQLFLGAPSETIAFIYKSLGCLYSLQPLSQSTAFSEPTVPALKTEGWILWQTIQLLLGPEEHSAFMVEAVQKWDVRDPATGEVFPKVLPRRCFPMERDKHMLAWYEGVSERLRREAEDQERQRDVEAERAEVRRLQYRKRDDGNDDESVDSRTSALAYFRDPLYRDRQDGRPTIVSRHSKRPLLSPRRSSVKDKAKEGATTVGHVIRNIGSPHLWDGRGSKNEDRDRSRDRRRRSSLPENRYHQNLDAAVGSGPDFRTPSYSSSHNHHHRSQSRQESRQDQMPPEEGLMNLDDENTPVRSRTQSSSRQRHHREGSESNLRHSRSAEPTPSEKEVPDYFHDYENASEHDSSVVTPNGIGPAFGPSASPLFASHIAKQPQSQFRPSHPQADYGPSRSSRYEPQRGSRHYSRSPNPSHRSRDRHDRHHNSRERRRHDQSPGRSPYNDGPTSAPSMQPQPPYPPLGSDSNRMSQSSSPYPPSGQNYPPSGSMPNRDRRRSGRMSGSDAGGHSGGDDSRRGSAQDDSRRSGQPKQARFASGVDGRRYPNESPWR